MLPEEIFQLIQFTQIKMEIYLIHTMAKKILREVKLILSEMPKIE